MAFATWILLVLGATLVAMCMCMAMQPFIMPRRVAKRAPSAIDYEQIPGLQVSRPDEDRIPLGVVLQSQLRHYFKAFGSNSGC
ncbi:unnamed protein product [Symbiodinium pilosum]|uniref:Uncharacterized protein n=1 Tax=Symbiodinium pilosum TaxID=2952 RepID=A0A812VD73_SYMPI|nr:unnamed protein product [Symbiodinium pilosum]